MVEPKFLFELLVRLFTDPSGFDRGGEPLDGGIRRQVRHIVFLPSSRPPLADEPDLVAIRRRVLCPSAAMNGSSQQSSSSVQSNPGRNMVSLVNADQP